MPKEYALHWTEYADCLEKSFAPTSEVPAIWAGAVSEGQIARRLRDKLRAMGITQASNRQVGTLSEDTVHLSLWVDWGLDADSFFERLETCQLQSRGKAESLEVDESSEVDNFEYVDIERAENPEDLAGCTGGFFIEGPNGGGMLEWGDCLWRVLPTGKGGGESGRSYYRYHIVSGGLHLFIRRDSHDTVANVWVEMGSVLLCRRGGVKGVWDDLRGMFAKEGMYILKDIVSRMDMYTDIDACGVDEFCQRFNDGRRVTRARKMGQYSCGDMNEGLYMVGRRYTGFSIGSDTKLRVYDKAFELRNDPIKWGVFEEKYDGIPEKLTRIEFQLRRVSLKAFSTEAGERIEGVESYLKLRENLWRYLTTEWFRLTAEHVDVENGHQNRADTWVFWEVVQAVVNEVVAPARRVLRKVQVNMDRLIKIGLGCFMKSALYEMADWDENSDAEFGDYVWLRIKSLGHKYFCEVKERHAAQLADRYGRLLRADDDAAVLPV